MSSSSSSSSSSESPATRVSAATARSRTSACHLGHISLMANRTLMGENSFYRRVKSPAICQPLQVVEVGGHVRVVEEVDMFARQVSFQLKSNMLPDYTRTFESEILPLLRKQKGFEDEITLSNPGSLDAIASVCGRTKPMRKLTTPIPT